MAATLARILRKGSQGSDVKALQTALNGALTPSPKLVPDGVFGGNTHTAVVRFQAANWLVQDGDVGPCTWNALMGTETYTPILHSVPFIPQPTNTSCWAASTAMVNRSTVPIVVAGTPTELLLPDGSLRNYSDTNDAVTGSAKFAAAHGLTVLAPASWTPGGLKGMLTHGPLMFDMLWDVTTYIAGRGSPGHMIVVTGIRGDDDISGVGTTLRIHDPWPPNKGKIYSVGYMKWMQEVPTRTYHIYHKKVSFTFP